MNKMKISIKINFYKNINLGLKRTITELKNSLEVLNIRFGQAKEKIGSLENKIIKIIMSEEQKVKKE